ncbi:MAG: hypothetical protein CL458_09960 [Acidimicrobiaceae bacterium]|nr:hypothetical protein [Acidimicrobiaceae bacterium]|tara:strand:- start:37417 stop:37665 length:249 start_codon:yes stop_codon:yes gene_type:complete
METPTLFEQQRPIENEIINLGRLKVQTRIREMNAERMSRQNLRETTARRHAAIARLRRRQHEADEVDSEYWIRRRNNIRLVQ